MIHSFMQGLLRCVVVNMVTQKVLQKSTFHSQDSENVVKQLNLDMEI